MNYDDIGECPTCHYQPLPSSHPRCEACSEAMEFGDTVGNWAPNAEWAAHFTMLLSRRD